MTEPTTKWLTVTEAAAQLGVSEKTLRKRIARGNVAAHKVTLPTGGWAWRVDATCLEGSNRLQPREGNAKEHYGSSKETHRSDTEVWKELSGDDLPTGTTDTLKDVGVIPDSRLSRVEGYMARDLEVMLSHAIAEAQAPLLERIEAMVSSNQAQTARIEVLTEEIKQLAAVQATHVAENVALRSEVELMAATAMAAQLAAIAPEHASESTHEPPQEGSQEVLDKSLMLDLQQAQELTDEIDSLQAENERLRFELEKTRRPWWQRFFFDP